MFLRAFAIWILFIVLAILNATLREKLISPALGEQPAHVVSSILLAVLIFSVTSPFIARNQLTSRQTLFAIGAMWLGLTVAFEFLFGHYVMGNSWKVLLADYNIFRGRTWLLVLLSVFFSPVLAARLFVR